MPFIDVLSYSLALRISRNTIIYRFVNSLANKFLNSREINQFCFHEYESKLYGN